MNKYNEWINSELLSLDEKEILKQMTKEDIEDAFYKDLEFGTAGIRGIMGLGPNRINKYTIIKITRGLANYLIKNYSNPSVVIACDTRNNSDLFKNITALVLNSYNIKTYVFDRPTSTPELSFAIKKLNCTSGIVITSSHNSKEYNGYKVYNSYSGQIIHPEDDLIIKEINDIDVLEKFEIKPKNSELYISLDEEIDNDFINENKKVIFNNELLKKYISDIKVTYTSFHGVGLPITKKIFDEFNVKYNIVKEQCIYDGNFTTSPEPNPEYIFNYDLAIKYAKENNSDLILATDPDADRIGVMYKNNDSYEYIDGNLLGIIYFYYILKNNKIDNNSFTIKSIVTTPYFDILASRYNIPVYDVLTGCKNIAYKKRIMKNDGYNYLFGYEESLGYMFDIDIEDKCGFSSIISILEIMCYCKEKNITLNDYINEIYNDFGYLSNETINYTYKGIDGINKINNIMNEFRDDKIELNNVKEKIDYLYLNDEIKTNALKFILKDNCTVMIRPSGTEPKIKIYINSINKDKNKALNNLNKIKDEINKIFN